MNRLPMEIPPDPPEAKDPPKKKSTKKAVKKQ